jgi:hypothetical protein
LYKEYLPSEWKEVGLSFKNFIKGYEAYTYYMSHPKEAVLASVKDQNDHGTVETEGPYGRATLYSEYVKHQLFQPFGDDLALQEIQRAAAAGDKDAYLTLLGAMAITVSLQDSHGNTYNVKVSNNVVLTVDEALDAASQFLGPGYTEAEPGRFVSADGLRQVRMLESDITGQHGGGPHMNFETWAPRVGAPGRFTQVDNWHIYLK